MVPASEPVAHASVPVALRTSEEIVTKPTRRLALTQWDVFTSVPLKGNSLAVFLDGRGLTDGEMQSLAKEMNLSETTFILPRNAATERERGVRVRIFTMQEELLFAGHPTLGTAFALRGHSAAQEIVLDLNVGKVPVRFDDTFGRHPFEEMGQVDRDFGTEHNSTEVTLVPGLKEYDSEASRPMQTVSTGVPF